MWNRHRQNWTGTEINQWKPCDGSHRPLGRDINKSPPTREPCPLLVLLHFSSMIYPVEKQVSLICLYRPTWFKNSLMKCIICHWNVYGATCPRQKTFTKQTVAERNFNSGVFPKWNGNSAKSGNLLNYWSMNWGQFKDALFHLCLLGSLVTHWSLTQEVTGLNDKYFSHWIQRIQEFQIENLDTLNFIR